MDCLTRALSINDIELILKSLDAIDFILLAGEGGVEDENKMLEEFNTLKGKELLDDLILHPNELIFNKANVLMKRYYESNEDLIEDPLATINIE